MSFSEKYRVTEQAMRPASDKRQCFYCQTPIGGYHKNDCVLIHKKVRVQATISYEVEVPAFWEASDIEFHRNRSSWCAGNFIDELKALEKESEGTCLCHTDLEFKFVEVTSEDYLDEK